MRVAILATDGVERVELDEPRGALQGAGAKTEIVSLHPGEIQARQFDLNAAGTFPVDPPGRRRLRRRLPRPVAARRHHEP